MVSNLKGRLQILGEWADGILAPSEEHHTLDMSMLNELILRRIGEVDLQLMLVGAIIMLGIDHEGGHVRYFLEARLPFAMDEGETYDLDVIQRRTSVLIELRDMGFEMVGDKGGSVRCYKEGFIESLEHDLLTIEAALAR